jgi:hypothetical protein
MVRARWRRWIISLAALLSVQAHAFMISTAPVGFANSAVAVDGSGIATVFWTIDDVPNTPPTVLGRRFDAAGDPVGPEYQVNTIQGLFVQNVDVAMNAAGASVVVWVVQVNGLYRVYARRYDALGVAQGNEVEVGNEIYAPTVASVAIDATGGFLVVWNSLGTSGTSGTDDSVRARRYDDTGAPAGPAFMVNTTAAEYPSADVEFTATGYVVAWATFNGDGTHAQRFDTSGNPVGVEIAVAGDMQGMSVASDGAGAFVLVSSDVNGNVLAWRYDANGSPVGGAIPVSIALYNLGGHVAMDSTGAFTVVWSTVFGPPEAQEHRIRLRRFDATGAPVTGEIDLSLPDGPVFAPVVGLLAPDGFIATWTRDPFSAGSIEGITWRPLTPVAGTSLRLRDPADASRRTVKMKLKDPLVSTLAALGIDPVVNATSVQLFNTQATGDAACFTLPAPAWTEKPTRQGRRFKYVDSLYANGPCKTAQVRPGELKISCKAKVSPIAYSLDEPSQGSIGVVVRSGDSAVCAEFGGVNKDVPGSFVARNAPRPSACPTPPSPCP